MDSTNRILSVVLAVIIVASTILTPLIAVPTAAAATNTQEQQTQNYESDSTQELESEESTTSNSSDDTSDSELDTSTPQELAIDEDGLQDDYNIQRGMDDLNVQDIEVENWNEVDGGATVEAFISADTPDAHYPFKYPVTVTFEAVNSSGEVVNTRKTQVVLRPHTQETDWSDVDFTNLDESDLKSYSAYASANFTFNQNNSSDYTFRVETQSTYNSALVESRQTNFTVDGTNTQNTANIDAVIQASNDYRELPTKSRANSYKVSQATPSYMEDLSLPTRNNADPVGTVSQFANMTVPNRESATISSVGGQMKMTIATEYIEPNSPQTAVIRYAMTGESDDISVEPISASGEEIDPNTDYQLTRGSQDECIEGNVTSVCLLTLSEDERNYLNQHGELFLSLESSEPTQAELLCHSVIGGGLETSDSNVCGIKSLDEGAKPVYSPSITDFSLVPSGDSTLLDEESPIQLDGRDPADFEIGITVRNTGTAPLQGDEPLQVFQNSTFDTPSEETITKTSGTDYNSNLDNQSVTYTFSRRYPTSNISYTLDGQTNDGVIEIQIEDDEGDTIYRTFNNINGEQEIQLTELGGYTETLSVTVNAIYGDTDEPPTVNSMEATAVDQESQSESSLDLDSFSEGSGSLAPGETRTHVFPASELDLENALDPSVTFTGEFGNDTEELIVQTAGDELVADAGGPYNVQLDVDQWSRSQTGYGTIIANEQPGSEWEQEGVYTESVSDTMTFTTTHEDVPEVNTSTSDAIQYYEDNGYVHNLEAQLPENYASEMTISEIRYENYTGDEVFYGTEAEISGNSDLSYDAGNWNNEGFVGEDLQDYETERAIMFRNQIGDLAFQTDNSDAIYFNSLDEASVVERTLRTVEQNQKPDLGQDAPNCADTSEYPCWEQGDYIETVRTTDGYTDTQCQTEDYYDPGPDWYLESVDGDEVCWTETDVVEETDIYRWSLLDEVEEVSLYIPNYENYQEHTRPTYDMEIVWERSRNTSATQYTWNGPEYTVEPDTSATSLQLDGSETQAQSTVPIEDYQWYINGEEVSVDGLLASTDISEEGRHEVQLTVQGGGLTDTDTTHIDADVTCGELNVCNGEDHPEVTTGRVTSKVDSKYREGAIEAELSEIPQEANDSTYRLTVNPAENVLEVSNSDECPTSYGSSTYTLPDDEDQLSNDDLLDEILTWMDEEGVSSMNVTVCEETNTTLDSAPDYFIHPEDIDDSIDNGNRNFTLNESATKTFWEGSGIPQGGLEQVTTLNPRFSDQMSNGIQEFTVEVQVREEDAEDTSWNTVDRATTSIEFCEADTSFECPELNSDLDSVDDETDACPYTIEREEEPCEGRTTTGTDQQVLVFGLGDDWQIETDTGYDALNDNSDSGIGASTDERYIGVEPSHALSPSSSLTETTPYSEDTVEMYTDAEVLNNDSDLEVIAHYPLDFTADDSIFSDSLKQSYQVRDSVNSYNGEIFRDKAVRDYSTTAYVETWTPVQDDGERDHLQNIYGWNPHDWSGGTDSPYFVKQEDRSSRVLSGYRVKLEVNSGDRGDNYVLDLTEQVDYVDADSGEETYYESEYGSDWENAYNYNIVTTVTSAVDTGRTAPTGNGYAFDPASDDVGDESKYPYISLANYTQWPGDNEPQENLYPNTSDEVSASTHNLHEEISNGDSFDLAFRYKPTLTRESTTEQVVMREIDGDNTSGTSREEGQDVIVYSTEDDYGSADSKVPDDKTMTADELHLGTLTIGNEDNWSDEAWTFHDEARNSTGIISGNDGDVFKFVLWQDDESNEAAPIQAWNTSESNPEHPQNVSESDYYIESYEPTFGEERHIVTQMTRNKEARAFELAYVSPDDFWDTSEKEVYIDYNNGSAQKGLVKESDYPFLQLRGKTDKDVIRPHRPDGWRHVTIHVDTDNDVVTYNENYPDISAGVSLTEDPGNKGNNYQLFMGGGWEETGLTGPTRNWGGKFSGEYSNIRLVKGVRNSSTGHSEILESYQPDSANAKTEPRSVPQEDIDNTGAGTGLLISDVTYTKDNILLVPDINWKRNTDNQAPTAVTITAVPTDTIEEDSDPGDGEYYEVKYEYNPSTGSVTETVDNRLAEDLKYKEFQLQIEIDTLEDQNGWKAPEVNRVDIRNYNPEEPDVPPTVAGDTSDVETSGGGDPQTIPAPEDSTSSGGSVNLEGLIDYDGRDEDVPVKFTVRYNNTTIHEGTINTADSMSETATLGWRDLQEAGLEPRSDSYRVEFVVEEHPDDLWVEDRAEIGEFVMCETSSC